VYGQYKRWDDRNPRRALVADYTFGVSVLPGPVSVRVGYAAFAGVVANVAVPDAHVSASGVLGDDFKYPTYLRLGADWVPSAAGYTSAYLRRMGWRIPPRYDVSTGDPIEDQPNRIGFLTAHAEQRDIVEFFDVALGAAIAPAGAVHEARASFHTYDFHLADPRVRKKQSGRSSGKSGEGPRLLVTGGVAGMPNRPYYGEEAAIVPSFRADLGIQVGRGEGKRMTADLTLRYAEPETLALFPMAHYPWETGFVITGEL
ncbi:MAG: hypothetical protein IT377_11555, partial [Polyangiaceae bacterium]|nr:hypothetical protein [Polyangiaceae bacterium]